MNNRTGLAVWVRIVAGLAPFWNTIVRGFPQKRSELRFCYRSPSSLLFLLVAPSSMLTRPSGSFSRTSKVSIGQKSGYKCWFGLRLCRPLIDAVCGATRQTDPVRFRFRRSQCRASIVCSPLHTILDERSLRVDVRCTNYGRTGRNRRSRQVRPVTQTRSGFFDFGFQSV